MKPIFILKHNNSVDGLGTRQTKFAAESRELLAAWIKQKHPAVEEKDVFRMTSNFTYMYDSYSLEEVALIDADDIRRSPDAAAKVKELQKHINELQAQLTQIQKMVL